jgi:hypothetical protein
VNFSFMIVVIIIPAVVITLPRRFPVLYRHSAFHPPPIVLWAACGTVITATLAIFVFLASTSHKATLMFFGMLLVFGLYAISRRKTLATLPKITPVEDSA